MNFSIHPQYIMFCKIWYGCLHCTHVPHPPKNVANITTKFMHEQPRYSNHHKFVAFMPKNYVLDLSILVFGNFHPLAENQHQFFVWFSEKTSQWKPMMRTAMKTKMKVVIGGENFPSSHLAFNLKTKPVFTFWEGFNSHGKK
jgi:hypothetical protein